MSLQSIAVPSSVTRKIDRSVWYIIRVECIARAATATLVAHSSQVRLRFISQQIEDILDGVD